MKLNRLIVCISICVYAVLLSSCSKDIKKAQAAVHQHKPNVILIYVDDVGYGDISSNGGQSIATPLYFASHDVHVPRVPDRRFAGKSGMGLRGDELLEMDWEVGQIQKTLDSLHIAKNTMIIFTSDNGPVLNDGYQDGAVQGAMHPKVTPYNKDLLPPREAGQPQPGEIDFS